MLFRRLIGLALVLGVLTGISVSMTPHTANASTTLTQTASLSDQVSDRGARACFGIGSENCCKELLVLASIAEASGNIAALGFALFGAYTYC
jgi:hypothetical protein